MRSVEEVIAEIESRVSSGRSDTPEATDWRRDNRAALRRFLGQRASKIDYALECRSSRSSNVPPDR